ncbi:potassium channel family protein [Paenibacillus lemnae]|uniref:Two pore domain potassium channel family protein n=1 Tax=Paenibacillus lemnae TaxID=1330551 RepID=A0A848M3Q1_PAELE|nr:potassium channel family protein [Paenibacillus lemnae]NMO95658.1 two pore domain potassium channel family protein [Paenibacillus lemnae]
MTWWMWLINIVGLVTLVVVFYNIDKRWSSKPILLAPLLIYIAISLEDLVGLIDLKEIVPGEGGMRVIILLFTLASAAFYILYIFRKIAESVHKEITIRTTLIRISFAALTCILFFTLVYMSIYKLFGRESFVGENLGEDSLSQFISFFYFSVITFVTVGYGDVAPGDNTARLAVIIQIVFSFVTVGYALSMLGTLRQIFTPGEDDPDEAVKKEQEEAAEKEEQEEAKES